MTDYLECYILVSLIGELHGARALLHQFNRMYKYKFRRVLTMEDSANL
jgi:hypothetical protein